MRVGLPMRSVHEALEEESIVAAFPDHERAVQAAHALDEAGFPPDRVGIAIENVRQAREAAGSFSAAGAIVGAVVGAIVAAVFVIPGRHEMRQNVVPIMPGAPAPLLALGANGPLPGRA